MTPEEIEGLLAQMMRIIMEQDGEIAVLYKAIESQGLKLDRAMETGSMVNLQAWETMADRAASPEFASLIRKALRLR